MEKQFNIRINAENGTSLMSIPFKKTIDYKGHKFVLHKSDITLKDSPWTVSEYSTGMKCCHAKTIKDVLARFYTGAENRDLARDINYYINKYGVANN